MTTPRIIHAVGGACVALLFGATMCSGADTTNLSRNGWCSGEDICLSLLDGKVKRVDGRLLVDIDRDKTIEFSNKLDDCVSSDEFDGPDSDRCHEYVLEYAEPALGIIVVDDRVTNVGSSVYSLSEGRLLEGVQGHAYLSPSGDRLAFLFASYAGFTFSIEIVEPLNDQARSTFRAVNDCCNERYATAIGWLDNDRFALSVTFKDADVPAEAAEVRFRDDEWRFYRSYD